MKGSSETKQGKGVGDWIPPAPVAEGLTTITTIEFGGMLSVLSHQNSSAIIFSETISFSPSLRVGVKV